MRLPSLSGLILAAAFALSACGGGSTTPSQPTANSAATADAKPAATATMAPTATKAPTATPKPTASNAAEVIKQALKKVEQDKTYAMNMSATLQGDLGAGAPEGIDPNKPFEFMGMVGTVDGENSAFTMKGMIATMIGADAEKGIQFISNNGDTYVHGPLALMNAPEDKWYKMPAGDTSANSLSSPDMVDSMADDDLEQYKFKESGKESLNGQSCTVYDGDKEATKKALKERKEGNGLPTANEFGDIQDALMQFTICEDGYMHRMVMSFTGQPENQEKPVTMVMTITLSDFGMVAKIEAPTDAEEIKSPSN